MVLTIAEAFATRFFPTRYIFHIGVAILTILVLRAFSQGRRTGRDRDLHARTILVTGGFTPLGLTLLQSLAQRGAYIIALSSEPITSPNVSILVDLLRTTTSNEEIYAEECDLASPSSIKAFCTKFLTGKDQRLDAVIFAHEHQHIGTPKIFSAGTNKDDETDRETNSLATFLITTRLLPAVLVAPVERDIRIINVVNPFYAAAIALPFEPSFSSYSSAEISPKKNASIFLEEGRRSLRAIVFTRHLQRVLDALPTARQVPKTEEGSKAVPVVSQKLQKSNIVAISVSPGIGRVHTISNLLNANLMSPKGSYLGLAIYLLLQPLLRIFTKSPFSANQTILHALFVPTPFKILQQTTVKSTAPKTGDSEPTQPVDFNTLPTPEDMLLPGALYAECAALKLKVNIAPEMKEQDLRFRKEAAAKKSASTTGKGKATDETSLKEEVLEIQDDGEYGGELAGRLVWEAYEEGLKIWEKENPRPIDETKATLHPSVAPAPQPTLPKVEENPDVY